MSTIKAFKTIYYLFRNVKLFDFDDQTVKVQRKAGPSLPGKYIRGNSHTLPRGWMYWVVHCTSPLGSVPFQLPFTSLLWQSTCSIGVDKFIEQSIITSNKLQGSETVSTMESP